VGRRRRAYTDVNDLLVNDMMNGTEDPNNRVNKEQNQRELETHSEKKTCSKNEFGFHKE